MRLIDADVLMRTYAEFVAPSNRSDFARIPTWNDAVSLLGSAPTVDAEPVRHGRWIYTGFMEVKCSECSETFHELESTNYCPNCGAKMDGGEDASKKETD